LQKIQGTARLERELELAKSQIEGLRREWQKEKARVLVVQSELDLAQVRMMDSELMLARWKPQE
jgi:hypothetical protein